MKRPHAASWLLPALLSAALAAGGCETTGLFAGDPEDATPDASEWASSVELRAPGVDTVWERLRLVVAGEGYRVDEKKTSFEKRSLVTEWRAQYAPARFEGKRRRIHAEVVEVSPKAWIVKIARITQRNADIDDSMNPVKAEWEDDPKSDAAAGELLAWKIGAAFAE